MSIRSPEEQAAWKAQNPTMAGRRVRHFTPAPASESSQSFRLTGGGPGLVGSLVLITVALLLVLGVKGCVHAYNREASCEKWAEQYGRLYGWSADSIYNNQKVCSDAGGPDKMGDPGASP